MLIKDLVVVWAEVNKLYDSKSSFHYLSLCKTLVGLRFPRGHLMAKNFCKINMIISQLGIAPSNVELVDIGLTTLPTSWHSFDSFVVACLSSISQWVGGPAQHWRDVYAQPTSSPPLSVCNTLTFSQASRSSTKHHSRHKTLKLHDPPTNIIAAMKP